MVAIFFPSTVRQGSSLSGSDTLSDSLTEISELTGYQEYQISEISGPIFCFAGSIPRQLFVLRGPSGANFLFCGVHPAPIFCFTGSIRRQFFVLRGPSDANFLFYGAVIRFSDGNIRADRVSGISDVDTLSAPLRLVTAAERRVDDFKPQELANAAWVQ